jgi:hypothetical protein
MDMAGAFCFIWYAPDARQVVRFDIITQGNRGTKEFQIRNLKFSGIIP